jgi:hypothetical protein
MSSHARNVAGRAGGWLAERFRNNVANTFAWSSCMSTRDSELEADTLDLLVIEPPSEAAFAFSPLGSQPVSDEERILEPDEIAAELIDSFEVRFLPPTPAQRRERAAQKPSSLPPMAATPVRSAHSEISVNGSAHAAELAAAREELLRLQTQMRARDAYLSELERALDASTRQLEASGIGSVEDAYRMLGRLRGQSFRIAELESELRDARQAIARVQKTPRAKARSARGQRTR